MTTLTEPGEPSFDQWIMPSVVKHLNLLTLSMVVPPGRDQRRELYMANKTSICHRDEMELWVTQRQLGMHV